MLWAQEKEIDDDYWENLVENHTLNEDDNTPEIVREQMRIAKLEELIRLRLRAGGKKSIYIPYEKQEKNHWCGPASVRMVVRAKGEILPRKQLQNI